VIALCLIALLGLAILITLDLASDDIAGAFRDALEAFQDQFRP
jgi:hypothetical protein